MPEITRQSDYYGLATPRSSTPPSPEKVAELLRPAPLWEGPSKVSRDDR